MAKAEDYGWQPFDTLPDGTMRHVKFDADGNATLRRDTPMANINAALDNNATARNHTSGKNADGTMVRAASIPYAVGMKWLAEEGWWFEDPQHVGRLLKKLNDPDWAYLRTGGGRLAMTQDNNIR